MTHSEFETAVFFGRIAEGQRFRVVTWKFKTSPNVWTEYYIDQKHEGIEMQAAAFQRSMEALGTTEFLTSEDKVL